MNDLVDFLTARLDEDEAAAREEIESLRYGGRRGGKLTAARVLADVEAKRKIIEKIAGWGHYYVDGDSWFSCGLADDGDGPGSGCADDDRRGTCDCRLEQRQNEYLALLALPDARHPDYREEWWTET